MKKMLFILLVVAYCYGVGNAGLQFGMPSAVKKQVEKLDQNIADKKAKIVPSSVSAIAGNGAVEITWSPVSGATSYNLYWGQSSTQKVAGVTSPYLLTGLINDTVCHYSIAAVVGKLESDQTVSATILPDSALPLRPGGLSGAHGNMQIALTWNAVPGVSSYDVYWSATCGINKSSNKISGVSGTAYTHTGLSVGTKYYYRISAVNGSGESLLSDEIGVFTNRPFSAH